MRASRETHEASKHAVLNGETRALLSRRRVERRATGSVLLMNRVVPRQFLPGDECDQGAEENLTMLGANELHRIPETSSPQVVGGEADWFCGSMRPGAMGTPEPVLGGAERRRPAGCRILGQSRLSHQNLLWERSQGFPDAAAVCCPKLLLFSVQCRGHANYRLSRFVSTRLVSA